MWKRFPPEIKREIEQTGAWARPSQYSDQPYLITRGLIEEGRSHLLLDDMIETGCPVRILQGVQDPDVPWQHAVELSSPLCPGRRGAHVGQGRRPPPVAPRGYRAAHRGGCRILGRGQNGFSQRIKPPKPAPPAWGRRDDRRLETVPAGRRGTWVNAASRRARF
jgi:hypothetical protein